MNRIKVLDNTKGFLILLIIIGHVFTEGFLHDIIYTFHVPAFFIISGMTLKKQPIIQFISKKFRSLIIPMLSFEILFCISVKVFANDSQSPFGYLYNLVSLHFNCSVNWFLFTLFFASIISLILISCTRYFKWIFTCILICATFILKNNGNYYINLLSKILIASVLILIGYSFRNYLLSTNKIAFIIAIILFSICVYLNSPIELSANQVNNYLLFLIGSVSGTYASMYICRYIRALNFVGLLSLQIMLIHCPLLQLTYFNNIAKLITITVVSTILAYATDKYVPFIYGKSKPISNDLLKLWN